MTVIPFPSRHSSGEELPSIDGESDDQIPGVSGKYTYSSDTQLNDLEAQVSEGEWKQDAERLGTNELRQKYGRSFSTFNNMKQRGLRGEATIHLEFANFKKFFGHMGPRRSWDLTLDRTDHTNPMYGPGLCQWVDKKAQARNRRSTTFLRNPQTGEQVALTAFAEDRGIPPSRVRWQRKQGWSDEEIFAGRRLSLRGATVAPADRWPWELEPRKIAWWEEQYRKHRRPVTDTGFEFRYEFALRSLRAVEQENLKFIHAALERFGSPADENAPASDGRDQMPPEFREDYDRKVENQAKVEQRIREATEGEASWRASVTDRMRPRIPRGERDFD